MGNDECFVYLHLTMNNYVYVRELPVLRCARMIC